MFSFGTREQFGYEGQDAAELALRSALNAILDEVASPLLAVGDHTFLNPEAKHQNCLWGHDVVRLGPTKTAATIN